MTNGSSNIVKKVQLNQEHKPSGVIWVQFDHSIGMNSRATQLKFGVHACRITHLITIMAASQLHFLANENTKLAVCSQ